MRMDGLDGPGGRGAAECIVEQMCSIGQSYCGEYPPRAAAARRWDLLKTHAGSCQECGEGLQTYARVSGALLVRPFTLRMAP